MRPITEPAYGGLTSALKRFFHRADAPSDPTPAQGRADEVRLSPGTDERHLSEPLAALGARVLTPPDDTRDVLTMRAHPLQRPVILVQGLAQHADCWFNLKQFLCTDPDNHFGGVYRAGDEAGFEAQVRRTPGANMFAIEFTDSLAGPRGQAVELAAMIDQVKRLTGATHVDLVTHSMGGVVAREYLHGGLHDVSSLVMLAPPNHGAAVADAALAASRLHAYHHYPVDHQEALIALQTQDGLLGGERNAYLADLERAWPTDSAGVKTTVIAGTGFPTPSRSWMPVVAGDGFVSPHSAHLDGADFYVASARTAVAGTPAFRDFEAIRYNHLHLMSEYSVLQKVDEALAADTRAALPAAPFTQMSLFELLPDGATGGASKAASPAA